jgi:acyl transferase domain-containing protein
MQALRSVQDGAPNPDVIGPHLTTPTQLVFVYTDAIAPQARPLPGELRRLAAYEAAYQAARRALGEHAPRIWAHDQPVASAREAAQATFTIQIALTGLLAAHGVHPHTAIGDGVGRAASAYARGALTLGQAARHALDPARAAGADRGWPIAQAAGVGAPTTFVVIGPHPGLARTLADAAGPHHHISVVSCDPSDLAHALGELYTLGHYPAGPACGSASSVQPAMTVPVPQVPPARHDWVSAHLLAVVRRVAHIDPGTPATVTWAELQLSDRQTIRLVALLRQVPAWSHLTTGDLHPRQSLSECAATLTDLLTTPATLEVSR